jgi:hypothetical protein
LILMVMAMAMALKPAVEVETTKSRFRVPSRTRMLARGAPRRLTCLSGGDPVAGTGEVDAGA